MSGDRSQAVAGSAERALKDLSFVPCSLVTVQSARLCLPCAEVSRMKLFGYLPESLFQPLSGPKKHVYARLLMRLYERVYSARILETPLREEVVKQIEIGLSESGIGSTDELSEEGSEGQGTSQAHYLAYYRLRDTGWLTEEREK